MTSPRNYSRWNTVGDDDDDDESPRAAPPAPAPTPMQPPPDVREDLEDYFRRFDERLSRQADASVPSVPRFLPKQVEQLLRDGAVTYAEETVKYNDCAVCLEEFKQGDPLARFPCAAQHVYHVACARAALAADVSCPLCRVDILEIFTARSPASKRPQSPRALGFTRGGGVILRWEPRPPADMIRPDYIPRELHDEAGYVEVSYPDAGLARVWRLARPQPGAF